MLSGKRCEVYNVRTYAETWEAFYDPVIAIGGFSGADCCHLTSP